MARFVNRAAALGMVAAISFSVTGREAWAQATGHFEMMAARAGGGEGKATSDNRSEVRLLWIVTEGWVPSSGVNIYRSDNPTKPLNVDASGNTAVPIKFNAAILDPAGAAVVNTPTASTKPLFAPGIANRAQVGLSSKAAFMAFKNETVRLQNSTGTRGSQIAAQAAKMPEVVDYRSRLLSPKQTIAPKTPVALSGDDAAASVRIQVMISVLSSYQAAQKLGFAFRDTTALPGTSYTYTLKAAAAGATTLATVQLPASGDTLPPSPAELDGVQNGSNSVALHWEPVTADQEKKLGSISYSVYRNGVKITDAPLRLVFHPTKNPTKDGGHVAAMTSFVDANAPLGVVTYEVKTTDVFGRESSAATVSVTVKDLRVPGPIKNVLAHPSLTSPGGVRVLWAVPDKYAGDIGWVVAGNQIQYPDITYALFRTEGKQTEISLTGAGSPLSDPDSVAAGAVFPADLRDLTCDDLLRLLPDLEAGLRSLGGPGDFNGGPSMDDKQFAALRPLTIDKLYARLNGLFQKQAIHNAMPLLRSYVDTGTIPDKDYLYRVAPAYVVNPTRLGTGAQTGTVSVPTTSAPGMPASLQAVFQKGTGNFGFADTATASGFPTLRTQGKVGAGVQVSHIAPTIAQKASQPAYSPPHTPKPGFVSVYKGTPADTEKNTPMTIAGQIKLTWQAVPFTSKIRYRIYRATATGLFPAVQTASLGLPPTVNLNTIPKIGGSQRLSMKAVAAKRLSIKVSYYENFPSVPNQNYALLTVTDNLQYVDTVSTSQRVHYHYRIVPVTRWGVEGPETPITDVMVPATLPPTLPTLLKTEVDEATTGGLVKLTLTVNPPQDNVQTYLIFRKPVSNAVAGTAYGVMTNRSSLQVVSANARYAPPVPQVKLQNPAPPHVKSVTIRDMKANNSAILKRILDANGYVKVGEVPAPTPSAIAQNPLLTWTDTTGLPKVQYAYEVVAVNTDAIASKPSAPLDATAIKVKADAPRNLASVLDQSGDAAQITVSWQAPAQEAAVHYVLERASERLAAPTPTTTANGPLGLKQTIKTLSPPPTFVTVAGDLDGTSTMFSDPSVRSGRRYIYRLRAVDADGLFSDALKTTVVYPALAPAVFNDPAPAPPSKGTGKSPVANTGRDPVTPPTAVPVLPVGTPLGSPKPVSKSAVFGETYFLTDDQVFAVRVEKAIYRASAYAIDAQNFYYCRPTEKFLQLTLRVKNMTGTPQPFDYQTVTATSTTADGAELAVTKNWKALDTGKLANRSVAPNSELVLEGVVIVPADGTSRGLSFGDDVFDLGGERNVVAPLPATFGGSDTIAPEYPVPDAKAFWPMAYTEASFAEGGFTTQNNTSVYTVTLNVKNVTRQAIKIAPNNYTLELFDEDGDKYTSQKNDTVPVSLEPDAQTVFRWTFVVPKTISLKSLKARERDSRVYIFPIGAK